MVSLGNMSDVFIGLSSDTKPTDGIYNGSVFLEMNTGVIYMWDAEGQEWLTTFTPATEEE